MTKTNFIKLTMRLRPSAKEWRRCIDNALKRRCIPSLKNLKDDYMYVYALAGAISQDYAQRYLNGFNDKSIRRKMIHEANNIVKFI